MEGGLLGVGWGRVAGRRTSRAWCGDERFVEERMSDGGWFEERGFDGIEGFGLRSRMVAGRLH